MVPLLLAVVLPLAVPLRRLRWRRRRRVCLTFQLECTLGSPMEANNYAEKEESDEDMGFGLFD